MKRIVLPSLAGIVISGAAQAAPDLPTPPPSTYSASASNPAYTPSALRPANAQPAAPVMPTGKVTPPPAPAFVPPVPPPPVLIGRADTGQVIVPAIPAGAVPALPTTSPAARTARFPQVRMALDEGSKAQAMLTSNAPRGVNAGTGKLSYAYGASNPVVTCAPLHLCVINLMAGEVINDMSIGDSVRWLVQASQAGNKPVVVVKPTESGLTTNLVITTSAKRVYYLTLESNNTKYLPQIEFYEPGELLVHNNRYAADAAASAVPTSLDPSSLDFGYSCKANSRSASMQPTTVFAANGHVYVQMPADTKYGELPAVFNTSNGGNELINSRYNNGYYIIDGMPASFVLALGNRDYNRQVTCERTAQTKRSRWFGL